jgi:hypothetical protein
MLDSGSDSCPALASAERERIIGAAIPHLARLKIRR